MNIKNNDLKNFEKSSQLLGLLCNIFSDGNDFPALIKEDRKIDLIKFKIEEKACDDETFCPKAIKLYSQIRTILEEFAKENDIHYKKID